MSLKSFKTARTAFFKNLSEVLNKLNYTPASLSMKLNNAAQMGGSVRSVVSASDINDWTTGKKVPSLYVMFKLCDYLRISIDNLLDTTFDIDTIVSRSFANQNSSTPKINSTCPVIASVAFSSPTGELVFTPARRLSCELPKLTRKEAQALCPTLDDELSLLTPLSVEATLPPPPTSSSVEDRLLLVSGSVDAGDIVLPSNDWVLHTMSEDTKTTSTTKPTKSSNKSRTPVALLQHSLVVKHTSSTNYNSKLAYAVLTSGFSVQDIAKAVGVSPSALRDYMYYNVSIPSTVGKALLRILKSCNYATLGLKFDAVKTRYTHVAQV